VLKVFADEHVAHALVNGPRTLGMDVVTVQDVGLRSEDDPPPLDFACGEQRVLLTNDHDFLAHAAERSARLEPFAPIVYWPQQQRTVSQLLPKIINIAATLRYEKACSQVFFL
jgi:hypothetical protein